MQIDVDTIRQRLFENVAIRSRILHDYRVATVPSDPGEFTAAVIQQFHQEGFVQPLEQCLTNADVFCAAAKALPSNMRNWATVLKSEPKLRELLADYDPVKTQKTFEGGTLHIADVQACLGGQTGRADAAAIGHWAKLLTDVENYYGYICQLGRSFKELGREVLGAELPDSQMFLCVVAHLVTPSVRSLPSVPGRQLQPDQLKLPKGMAYVLASEFLRNLHWNGFKPDRHVKRLFDRWMPGMLVRVQPDVERLLNLVGRKNKDLRTYLTYSLAGIAAAPPGLPLSHVDNLVWLLGAYVEKAGRETSTTYVIAGDRSEVVLTS